MSGACDVMLAKRVIYGNITGQKFFDLWCQNSENLSSWIYVTLKKVLDLCQKQWKVGAECLCMLRR